MSQGPPTRPHLPKIPLPPPATTETLATVDAWAHSHHSQTIAVALGKVSFQAQVGEVRSTLPKALAPPGQPHDHHQGGHSVTMVLATSRATRGPLAALEGASGLAGPYNQHCLGRPCWRWAGWAETLKPRLPCPCTAHLPSAHPGRGGQGETLLADLCCGVGPVVAAPSSPHFPSLLVPPSPGAGL